MWTYPLNIIGYDHGDFKDGVLFSLSENLALRDDLSAAASAGGMSSPRPTARLGLVRAETVNLFVSSFWAWPLGVMMMTKVVMMKERGHLEFQGWALTASSSLQNSPL